jgi:hypothetical protein
MWMIEKQYDDDGRLIGEHAVPVVWIDDHYEMSAAHDLAFDCPCNPLVLEDEIYVTSVIHHDPDHPGAMSEEEWHVFKKSDSPLEARP